jgi:hypothetical protein
MLRSFPMIMAAVILYNLVTFGGGLTGQHDMSALLTHGVSIGMFSGDHWNFTLSDLFVLFTLAMLFVEIIKATRTSTREVVNHALSMLTFIVALVEFIVLKGFSTSAFFFILVTALFDVVAGYTISIVAAKHDIGIVSSASH